MELYQKEIPICNSSCVADIETAFTLQYPFLKIELYKIAEGPGHLRSVRVASNTQLKQLAKIGELEKINISSNRTVAELTHDIEHLLGSIVRISRMSGKVWISVSVTEGWTLENQNFAGRYICSEMNVGWSEV